MAREIVSDKREEQVGFWRYVFESGKLEEALEREDEEGNSLFHDSAGISSGENGNKILQLLPVESFVNLHKRKNKNLDTALHVAMKNKRTDVFDKLMLRFNKRNFSSHQYPWLKKILTEENIDGNTVMSIAIKSDMPDNLIIGMINKLYDRQT